MAFVFATYNIYPFKKTGARPPPRKDDAEERRLGIRDDVKNGGRDPAENRRAEKR